MCSCWHTPRRRLHVSCDANAVTIAHRYCRNLTDLECSVTFVSAAGISCRVLPSDALHPVHHPAGRLGGWAACWGTGLACFLRSLQQCEGASRHCSSNAPLPCALCAEWCACCFVSYVQVCGAIFGSLLASALLPGKKVGMGNGGPGESAAVLCCMQHTEPLLHRQQQPWQLSAPSAS
jgi:hypothetical protein